MGNLVNNVYTVREVLDECSIEVNTVSLLPDVKIVVCIIEIIHPVIFTRTCL